MQKTKLPNAVMAAVGMSLFYALIYASSAWPAPSTKNASDRNFSTPLTFVPSVSQDSDSMLLARGRNFCNSNESVFFAGESDSFWVYICGGDRPHYYIGVEKNRPTNLIRLPLRDYGNEYFEAVNGEFTYIVSNTPRGRFLTVSKGYRELLREVVSEY
jgi:hypothetical protein